MGTSRFKATWVLAVAITAAAPTFAATLPMVDVPSGPLSSALTVLGRQANIDILFSDELVGGQQAPALRGRVDPEQALARMLVGTGLAFHRTLEGAYVINRASDVAAKPLPPAEDTIPEILVIGRKAQNSDIRRTESDIQPYQVFTRRDVERAHSDSIDDFARTRLPANAQIASPAQLATNGGDTRSEINLRGLGANQTLILVDGRRQPNLPKSPFSFNQPDTSGIPVEMIDRIEVLSGTAGGVYGTGATSGAVNIVLRRDYRGFELAATTGLTTRGDAFQYRLFGRIGFTPDHGRTDVMLAVSTMQNATLHASERDYFTRARKRRFANDPEGYLDESPVGNAINIYGYGPLVLKPEFGGNALGSTFTTLPLGSNLDVAARNAALVANAGTTNFDLPPSTGGRQASIASTPTVRSLFFNTRHNFGGGIEAFVDVIASRNRGHLEAQGQVTASSPVLADNPNNPFNQEIRLAVPLGQYGVESEVLNETLRYTAGVIVPLPFDWRASAEYGGGRARTRVDGTSSIVGNGFVQAFSYGSPLTGSPPLDPLGDWTRFQTALQAYAVETGQLTAPTNAFRDLNVRVAGPVIDLPGGPLNLTLLAEERRESVKASKFVLSFGGQPSATLNVPRIAQRVRSIYGEARLPLTDRFGPLSKLELQLAVRRDWTRVTLPGAATFVEVDPPPFSRTRGTTLYTAGARFTPLPGVVLRGSTATGALPPATSQIGSRQSSGSIKVPDPRRGGRQIGTETTLTSVSGGSPDLKPERARSISAGMVLTPLGLGGPRLSLDFTRILKRNEIVPFPNNTAASLVPNELLYPDRVIRGPLSDADRALGFTGGPIQRLDYTDINLGRTRIDSVDLAFDQSFEVERLGNFQTYLRGTWEPHFRQRLGSTSPWIERVGYTDGPLEWRANAGVDWSRGRFTVGFNGQFYGRYKVTYATSHRYDDAYYIKQNGAAHIPAQVYIDLSGAYRFGADAHSDGERGPALRWGLMNVFDHRPPTVVDSYGAGYSYYGDPRRRRVQVTFDLPFGGR